MENYSKGKNVEEPLEKDRIPIPNLSADFLWMQVRGGSKIRNLVTHAMNTFSESVIWTGFGPSVGKAITCAEIMKREFGDTLHQITKICYRQVDEYWDAKIPELDQIVVKRKLPMIHILLSRQPLDTGELGYQAPGATLTIPSETANKKPEKTKKAPTKEFAALDVDARRRSKQYNKNKSKSCAKDN